MKKYYQIVLFTVLIVILAACGKETAENEEQETTVNYAEEVTENPIVTITMENDEKIVIELEPKTSPNTVANFISLVEDGFYDGLIFHRVIPGFMIQGGDPDGTGMGGPDYTIKGEFTSNGFENTLTHERGVISMARSQDPDSAGSQFFIMTEQATHLDGDYAAFGKVTEGMETVDEIVAAERAKNDKPLEDQKIKTVEVDTKGFDYPEPVVQK
ncbi:peptidyl-prolyl cis-trans isomerase B (cyclophilin B) [Solibacillus kalamii]|uniref:Peptidyl-prolyl cis-trans isomerase n=1 Tax=Solibacillus kalamii TaxID=1748298 RepID=A0ABX3ZFA4_9BACL|nr:peptidylprolyl isomerase [Solibacillus kalamii]MBM7666223.1 peptidyl-prolyl cis-trans isomerase B (cyclophilin B) [Solibacillus kalamii]OUZ38376.1 peptidylprolyl isomerase [Solibacillus kalamii]